MLLAQQYFIKN